MAEPRDFMTVGELAEQVGKTPRAIRLYEELGLLIPRGRTCGNYREYGPEALVRLRWITHLHELGLPLQEVKGFLDDVAHAPSAGAAMSRVRERYSKTLASVNQQLENLNRLREGLTESLDWLEACNGCEGSVAALATSCGGCDRHDGATEPELVRGVTAQPPSHLNPSESVVARCGGPKETP